MSKTAEEEREWRKLYMREYRQKRKQALEERKQIERMNNDIKYAEFQARYWAKRAQELKAASSEGVGE